MLRLGDRRFSNIRSNTHQLQDLIEPGNDPLAIRNEFFDFELATPLRIGEGCPAFMKAGWIQFPLIKAVLAFHLLSVAGSIGECSIPRDWISCTVRCHRSPRPAGSVPLLGEKL